MAGLNYSTVGSGEEPVIVMHEWLGDHSNYDPVLPYLNKRQYTWHFVDLRGYGLSKQLTGQYTCREAADDVHRLIGQLKLKKVHIVGHSMSAMVAQRIAVDNPELIQKLVLVTPVPASGIELSKNDAEMLKAGAHDDSVIRNAINLRTGSRYNSTWLDHKLDLANKAASVAAREGYLDMFLTTDFSREANGLKIPVRVIVGKFDIPAFQKSAVHKLFSDWYSDLEIIECHESGHYPMLECPVFFASAVETFLSNADI